MEGINIPENVFFFVSWVTHIFIHCTCTQIVRIQIYRSSRWNSMCSEATQKEFPEIFWESFKATCSCDSMLTMQAASRNDETCEASCSTNQSAQQAKRAKRADAKLEAHTKARISTNWTLAKATRLLWKKNLNLIKINKKKTTSNKLLCKQVFLLVSNIYIYIYIKE